MEDGRIRAHGEGFGEQPAALVHDAAADVGQGVSQPVQAKPRHRSHSTSRAIRPKNTGMDRTIRFTFENNAPGRGVSCCRGVGVAYLCLHRRDGRVVDCGGLENRCTARYRGFESLSLRKVRPVSRGETGRSGPAARHSSVDRTSAATARHDTIVGPGRSAATPQNQPRPKPVKWRQGQRSIRRQEGCGHRQHHGVRGLATGSH